MKILQLTTSATISGTGTHLITLSKWLRVQGHEIVTSCLPNGPLPEQIAKSGLRCVPMPMRGIDMLRAIVALKKIVQDEKIDVIHTHLTRAAHIGALVGRLTGVPVASSVHVKSHDIAFRYLSRRKNRIVGVSEYVRQELIKSGCDPDYVETIHNGTDFQPVDADSRTKHRHSVLDEFQLPKDALIVGQISSVSEFKGHHLLIEALPDVLKSCPNAYCLLVGHSAADYRAQLESRASDLGVGNRVLFVGPREDVGRLLCAIDVKILPSVIEACSMAIIEAMLIGIPVIATRAGGNPELVTDGETGFLIERDPSSIARAIVQILGDEKQRMRMGRAGRERALSDFTAEVMAERIEALYCRMLKNR